MAANQTPTAEAAATLVLAYRRKVMDTEKPQLSYFDQVIAGCRVKFRPNAEGHFVGSVPGDRPDVLARLLEISEAYVTYTGEGVYEEELILTAKDTEPPKPKYVISTVDDGGQNVVIDLKAKDDAALKAFIKDAGIKGVPGAAKGDTLRAAICRAVGQAVDDHGAFVATEEELANQ